VRADVPAAAAAVQGFHGKKAHVTLLVWIFAYARVE
jgi:hypothetical protein